MQKKKLHLLRGLPASGKSSIARLLVGTKEWTRVNRDLIREMLHFSEWTGKNEAIVIEIEKMIATQLLQKGLSVVVDDCNLSEHHAQVWMAVALANGAQFSQQVMDTHWSQCVEWDKGRDKRVGAHVIKQMALQYGQLFRDEISSQIVVCDIDGTIANIDHRLHHAQKEPKDWKSFFSEMDKDTVREDVKAILKEFEGKGYDIVFVSARPEDYREQTEKWLMDNLGYNFVLMRGKGDKRPDTMVKEDIYNKYLKQYHVHTVIDDRPQVIVKTWLPLLGRERIIDVGNNKYFVEERRELDYWTTV